MLHNLIVLANDLTFFFTIMALISLLAVAVVVAIGAIIHLVSNKEKTRLPAGVQPLPGPKGMLAFEGGCAWLRH